jgi:glycerol-3-phosphate acyltransferase PlsX
MIGQRIAEEFTRTPWARLAGLLARPVLQAVRNRIDPRTYNGATLVGLRGIVVKSHGSADAVSFANAIGQAVKEIDKNVPDRIDEQLSTLLSSREAG